MTLVIVGMVLAALVIIGIINKRAAISKVLSPLAIGVVVAATVVGGAIAGIRVAASKHKVTVYVLSADKPAGLLIGEDEVKPEKKDRQHSGGTVRSRSAVVDHVATHDLKKEIPLKPSDVVAKPLDAGTGQRAFAIPITSDVTVSEPVRAGDRVDLGFAAFTGHETPLKVARVPVLEMRQSPDVLVVSLGEGAIVEVLEVLGRARLVVLRVS